MFTHTKRFQYNAKPDAPDPIFAKQMQELIGGQWGEMSVMVNYLFQGWNCRGPAKYRDMLLDTATEEIGHVEMLATMVARLLETSPVEAEKAAENGGDGGVDGAVLGGGDTQQAILSAAMNPQHAIVTGGGSTPRDSLGNPWNAAYTIASGNLLADMRFNVTAESQGRLQVARLYQLTGDAGVRDMFSFLLARDTMHQNQWLAALEELKSDGLEDTPVPSNFPQEQEMSEVAYRFMNFSEGEESRNGRWAQGSSMDGKGEFEYVAEPEAMGPEMDELDPPVEPRLYSIPLAAHAALHFLREGTQKRLARAPRPGSEAPAFCGHVKSRSATDRRSHLLLQGNCWEGVHKPCVTYTAQWRTLVRRYASFQAAASR